MKHCCNNNISKKDNYCIRNDNKIFNLPRKFTRKQCQNIKGFSMRSSCAPFKYCIKNLKYLGGNTRNKREKKQFKQNKKTNKFRKKYTNNITRKLRR